MVVGIHADIDFVILYVIVPQGSQFRKATPRQAKSDRCEFAARLKPFSFVHFDMATT